MTTTTEEAIRRMLAGGETGTVEFKIKAPRPSELAERTLATREAALAFVREKFLS